MADETPEAIRERVHAEELAKGSDPRVAEGRAKAAELRARAGLPIDPHEAARAKLAREGGATPAAVAEAPAAAAETPVSGEASVEAEALIPAGAPPPPAPVAEAAGEPAPPAAVAAQAEAPAGVAAVAPTPVAPPPAAAAPPEAAPEPEIGVPIEVEGETVTELAGIRIRDARLPVWLLALLVLIPLWAVFYLVVFAGPDVTRNTTGCVVQPDRSLVCFLEEGADRP